MIPEEKEYSFEERCAAVARVDQERKERCEKILKEYEEKKNAWKKKLDEPVKLRLTKKELKEMGFKIITQ